MSQEDISPGETVIFSVSPEGEPDMLSYTYQWMMKTDGDQTSAREVGQDSNELIIYHVLEDDEGDYYCIVSNSLGSVQSITVRLSLSECLVIHASILHLDCINSMIVNILLSCSETSCDN